MTTHLKDRKYYEDRYDRFTVEYGRRDLESFKKMHEKFFKECPNEDSDSFRWRWHMNLAYMMLMGNDLVDRHEQRDQEVNEMMERDKSMDDKLANARLSHESVCQHCDKIGLRISDKILLNRNNDSADEVLFILRCPHCEKNSTYWEDGSKWEHTDTSCPKCGAVMKDKQLRKDKLMITIYTCPSCKHSYKDEIDLNIKEDVADEDFEKDRIAFCLLDTKLLEEHRDAKRRFEDMIQLGKELKDKDDNMQLYNAIDNLKKLKIAQLTSLLVGVLEKAGFIEFSLDKPEIGKYVIVGFSCLDGKSDRGDYDSQKTLRKIINNTLEDTNWQLMSDGISYRLGCLSGRLRAYENEDDLKSLVTSNKKLISKSKISVNNTDIGKNSYRMKGKDGRDIIF